jgi:hypothetical protein
MSCSFHLDFLRPDQFATPPRPRRSKKREKELELIKERGQGRRVLVSNYAKVRHADVPLYEALLVAGYEMIAVVFVIGHAEPADIKAAVAFSAKHPLPWIGPAMMPQYAMAMREFKAYLNE